MREEQTRESRCIKGRTLRIKRAQMGISQAREQGSFLLDSHLLGDGAWGTWRLCLFFCLPSAGHPVGHALRAFRHAMDKALQDAV